MANIRDLSIGDVKKFVNNKTLNNDEIYAKAFNMMADKSTSYKNVSINIVEWMMAYNVLKRNPNFKMYHIEDVRKLKTLRREKLAKSLGLTRNYYYYNNTIINILRYMHKLEGELKFEENLDLYKPLLLNSDLNGVVDLLKAKPSLKNLILNILPEILKNNFDNNLDDTFYFSEKDFLKDLFELKEFEMLEKSILIYKDLDESFDGYYVLFNSFFHEKMLDKYFKMLPKGYIFDSRLIDEELNEDPEVYYLIHETLKYAINNNDKNLIFNIKGIWLLIIRFNYRYRITDDKIKIINTLLYSKV